MKRLATIQDDGTVQFDVGENIKPQSSNSGAEVIYDSDVIKDIVITEDTELLPPLQIVMLIVGTRGDVQPFIAIGKRLQVRKFGVIKHDPTYHPFIFKYSFTQVLLWC